MVDTITRPPDTGPKTRAKTRAPAAPGTVTPRPPLHPFTIAVRATYILVAAALIVGGLWWALGPTPTEPSVPSTHDSMIEMILRQRAESVSTHDSGIAQLVQARNTLIEQQYDSGINRAMDERAAGQHDAMIALLVANPPVLEVPSAHDAMIALLVDARMALIEQQYDSGINRVMDERASAQHDSVIEMMRANAPPVRHAPSAHDAMIALLVDARMALIEQQYDSGINRVMDERAASQHDSMIEMLRRAR